MGTTKATLTVRNAYDVSRAAQGLIQLSEVRSVEVEAIVDESATFVCLPRAEIEKLDLRFLRNVPSTAANGRAVRRVFAAAEVELLGRSFPMDVVESDEGTPARIGRLLLEALDLVVDPGAERVTTNPEHDGEWVVDCFLAAR